MTNTMKQRAIDYLETRRGSWAAVASDSGVGYQWLNKFMQGKFDDPGVSKIEKILSYAAVGSGSSACVLCGCSHGVNNNKRRAGKLRKRKP